MEKDFFVEHGSAILAVCGALLTIVVTQFFNYLSKSKDHSFLSLQEKNKQEIAFKNKYVIEPILQYLESDLKMAQAVFSKGFHKNDNIDIDSAVQSHVTYIATLAKSINSDLERQFNEYSNEKIMLNTAALGENTDNEKAYQSLQKLCSLASQIIKELGTH